jgi:hypothetical protein
MCPLFGGNIILNIIWMNFKLRSVKCIGVILKAGSTTPNNAVIIQLTFRMFQVRNVTVSAR